MTLGALKQARPSLRAWGPRRVVACTTALTLVVAGLVFQAARARADVEGDLEVVARGEIDVPYGIASGPDGAIWFTNSGNRSIGRVSIDGSLQNFILPGTVLDNATSITTGPDGNLWFADAPHGGGGQLGRMTTDGVLAIFYIGSVVGKVAAGADGNLWFTQPTIGGNGQIGRITPSGELSEFTDASMSRPHAIALGSDGNMWFTNEFGNSISRITPSGVVSTFTAEGVSRPLNITSGPDGGLWFVNAGGASIGRITTSGAISTFADPGITSPHGISAGPDGALWFTNTGGDDLSGASIGRITPNGAVSSFPTPALSPREIVAGPDGGLWFTTIDHLGDTIASKDSISRMSLTGDVASYVGTGIDYPGGITSGPDGNLWFANRGGKSNYCLGSIGRLTTSGIVTLFSDPSIACPSEITLGPDGNMWFTQLGSASPAAGAANVIGKITPSGAISTVSDERLNYPSEPTSIAAGPDGALWFGCGWQCLGRVSTEGVFSFLAHPGSSPSVPGLGTVRAVAAGPDGNLWFAQSDRDNQGFGRVTPGGEFTLFDYAGDWTSIAAGPDGNMWAAGRYQLARISPDGLSEQIGHVNDSYEIARGPEGNLWFADGESRIGRVTPDGVITEFSTPGTRLAHAITAGPDGRVWYTFLDGVAAVDTGSPSDAPCDRTVVVGVRGSGDNDHGSDFPGHHAIEIGRQLREKWGVELYDPDGGGDDVIGVDYPAAPVPWNPPMLAEYDHSRRAGTASLLALLGRLQVFCEGRLPIVLVGYSQGAHVVQKALEAMDEDLSTNLHKLVVGVALIASPLFDPHDPAARGTFVADYPRRGVAGASRIPSALFGSRTLTWCLYRDPVCVFSVGNLQHSDDVHVNGYGGRVIEDAAGMAAHRIRQREGASASPEPLGGLGYYELTYGARGSTKAEVISAGAVYSRGARSLSFKWDFTSDGTIDKVTSVPYVKLAFTRTERANQSVKLTVKIVHANRRVTFRRVCVPTSRGGPRAC